MSGAVAPKNPKTILSGLVVRSFAFGKTDAGASPGFFRVRPDLNTTIEQTRLYYPGVFTPAGGNIVFFCSKQKKEAVKWTSKA